MTLPRHLRLAAALLCAVAGPPASAQDPASLDLGALVRCEVSVQDYNGFAFWLTGEPDALDRLGWTERDSGNPYLREFRLPEPLDVFGHRTSTVVFTPTGPMAVLDDADPAALAASLGVLPAASAPGQFLGEKVVHESSEEDQGTTYLTRITLNVSTVESHPGRTLAGCSYRLEIR